MIRTCGDQREAAITIGELGEFGLIAAITTAMAARSHAEGDAVILGPGDDAAVVATPDRRVVATTDMLIEGRHFRTDWSSATEIGHKAAARNLADVVAMGGVPTALLVCFAGPGHLSVDWVTELAVGIASECAAAGAAVAGGDTSSAETVVLAITALGDLGGRAPVTRSGARPADVVAVAGTLGSAAAGLDLLVGALDDHVGGVGGESVGGTGGESVGRVGGDRAAPVFDVGSSPELAALVGAHRRPSPPYAAGPEAAALGASSMIDVSDGLIADVGHIAEASGVRIELSSAALGAEPIARVAALRQAADRLGKSNWLPWVLTGGDDHALVATFPPEVPLPDTWTRVGTVARGHGVSVDDRLWRGAGGWDHFAT